MENTYLTAKKDADHVTKKLLTSTTELQEIKELLAEQRVLLQEVLL